MPSVKPINMPEPTHSNPSTSPRQSLAHKKTNSAITSHLVYSINSLVHSYNKSQQHLVNLASSRAASGWGNIDTTRPSQDIKAASQLVSRTIADLARLSERLASTHPPPASDSLSEDDSGPELNWHQKQSLRVWESVAVDERMERVMSLTLDVGKQISQFKGFVLDEQGKLLPGATRSTLNGLRRKLEYLNETAKVWNHSLAKVNT